MNVSTAVETETNTARVCRRCGASKPLDDFYRNPKGRDGRESSCRVCINNRKRLGERIAAGIPCPVVAPDPEPACRLRAELERQRSAGRSWAIAWPVAVRVALRDVEPVEAASWRRVFRSTRGAWQGSYTGLAWPISRLAALAPPDDEYSTSARHKIAA